MSASELMGWSQGTGCSATCSSSTQAFRVSSPWMSLGSRLVAICATSCPLPEPVPLPAVLDKESPVYALSNALKLLSQL